MTEQIKLISEEELFDKGYQSLVGNLPVSQLEKNLKDNPLIKISKDVLIRYNPNLKLCRIYVLEEEQN